jgi:hypothetical protein
MIANFGVALSCCMDSDGLASMVQAAVPVVDHDMGFHQAGHDLSDQHEQHECDCMAACTGTAPALMSFGLFDGAPQLLGNLDPVIGEDHLWASQSYRTASARAPPFWT